MYKKSFLSLLLALCFCSSVYSQDNKKLDSLLRVLDTQKDGANKINTLINISGYYLNNNTSKSIAYYEKAVVVAARQRLQPDLAHIYYLIGCCYQLTGDFSKSMDVFSKSAKIYEQLNDKPNLARVYLGMANVFLISGMKQNAGRWLDNTEKIIQQTKDSSMLCAVYTLRGTAYDDVPPYDSAMYFYKKELILARRIHYKLHELGALKNIAFTYVSKKNTGMALKYYDTILIKMKETGKFSLDNLSQLYNSIGSTWIKAGNYAKAASFLNKSLAYAVQIGQKGLEVHNYQDMANMYAQMKNYKQQSFYLTKYYSLKDSIYNTANKNQLTQTEADYLLEKKNNILIKEKEQTKAKTRERNLLIGFVMILMVLSIYIYLLQQKKYRQQQLLKEVHLNQQQKELELASSKMYDMVQSIAEKNQLIELLQANFEGQNNKQALNQLQHLNILTNQDWVKFKHLFEEVHVGYLKALNQKLPGLTPAEIRFMVLAKLNFDNKEMAAALGVSPQSMRVTWHRLRKKMNLPDDTSLTELVKTIM